MTEIMKYIFWGSVFMVLYVYLGYPALALMFSKLRNQRVKKGDYEPNVSILISAYNEEECIENTIKNKLDQDYPKEKIEIIVVSDGSSDKTDDIVRRYQSPKLKLLRQEPRSGKTAALNMAVQEAKGEALVFSDANSLYDKNAVRALVQNFNDPSVGYVTGKMIYGDPQATAIGYGCTSYMRYENILREIETKLGSVVGVDGGIDAVRKSLYRPMGPDQLPDFILPLRVIEQGYRVVYEPEAVLLEPSLQNSKDEYRMRVRVSLRALWALWDMKHLLQPFNLFAWQLWSHKVLRYGCFIFLISAFFSNLALVNSGQFYRLLCVFQILIYLAFILQLIVGNKRQGSKILYFVHYFMLLNLASAHSFLRFLLGQKQVLWTPRKG
jgi:cellulose synthase/poly-beta-1,6-N-acetylglucosamine synthase-like glycosyltransferase